MASQKSSRMALYSRHARGRIRKSFTFFLLDRSCAVSQRGCLPRPDQVSAGFFGFRYLGKTFGYGRRWRSEVITLLADPILCNRQFRDYLFMEFPQVIDGHQFQIAVFTQS